MNKNRSETIVILAAMLLLGPAPYGLRAAPPEGVTAADLQARAASLYRSNDYPGAIQIYKQLIDLEPKNVDRLKDLMWILWETKRYSETAQVAARIIQLTPDDSETLKLMGRAELSAGRTQRALDIFKKCLALNPGDDPLRQQIAHLEAETWNSSGTVRDLEQMQTQLPNQANVYARLALAQTRAGLFKEAAEAWVKAVELAPNNLDYRFEAAKAAYFSGHVDSALTEIQTLVLHNASYWPAIEFLIDDALARGDTDTAQELLENNLMDFHVEDEPRLLRLADIYLSTKKLDKSLKTLNRFLEVNPNSGDAMLLKAEVLVETGKAQEAIRQYEQILPLNPWSIRAYKGLAEAQSLNHHPELALKSIQKARTVDSTDPYLLILEGQYLYESGKISESKQLLLKWIDENPDPVVPVLLYHGLTTFTRDPMLAYSLNMTENAFAEQMRALKQHHFTPVTAEQVDGWSRWLRRLYHQPILISFDDARMDSFRYADPVLQQFGLKATMFVPLSNVEQNLPGYATWDILQQYKNTGRWEIQAHGDMAHTEVPIDAEGRKGLFLVNRKWIAQENRLETIPEWQQRTSDDHASLKHKFVQHLGGVPLVYAFPEGDFGQDSVSNFPEAGASNLMLARKAFGTAFHQDEYGLNVRSRDSMLLTRVEPKKTWSGEDLVRHITDNTPTVLIYRQLLRHAVWDGKDHEAYTWLAKLQEQGASKAVLFADEAVIRYNEEDYLGAKRLAEQSMAISETSEMANLLKSITNKERFDWAPTATYMEDNRTRQAREVENNIGFKLGGHTGLNLNQLYGYYSEAGTPPVIDRGAGVSVNQSLGVFQDLTVQMMGHDLSGQADTYSAYGMLRSRWTDEVNTELKLGRSLYDTASAMNDNIFERYVHVQGSWRDTDDIWRASMKGRSTFNTDNNNDFEGEFEGGYRPFPAVNLRGIYRFTLEDMKFISPDYYSPQRLIVNQLGFEYSTPRTEHFEGYLTYLPGAGSELNTPTEFVNDIEVGLPIRWGETTRLTPSFSLTTTPTYNRQYYNLLFVQQF